MVHKIEAKWRPYVAVTRSNVFGLFSSMMEAKRWISKNYPNAQDAAAIRVEELIPPYID